jgi:CRISPR type III-A-associated protein Csm2
MAVKGVITRLIPGKDFFFIDKDYFCHFSKVSFEPQIGMEVEYEQAQNRDGKPEARNVKPIGKIVSSTDFFSQYLDELSKGYFIEKGFIKKEFILELPKGLSVLFGKNPAVNKSAQIRKYFDFCRKIEGIYKVQKNFNYVVSELPRLNYHIHNALNKKPPLISKEFCEFIEKNVEMAIVSEDNFLKGFIIHFESVIGYSKN